MNESSSFSSSSSSPSSLDQILGIPGFGYYKQGDWDNLDLWVNLSSSGGNLSGSSESRFRCDILSSLFSQSLSLDGKGLESNVSGSWCPPLWDNISCLPATAPGSLGILPCISEHYGVLFSTSDNASRFCLSDGSWSPKTNYSACRVLTRDHPSQPETEDILGLGTNTILYIYIVGYSLSILALILSLGILLGFRELQSLRNKIHSNLFLTLLLSNSLFLCTLLMQRMWPKDTVLVCINHALVRYFHLTTFFWMFVEGLNLFLQVQIPYFCSEVKLRHYMMIGWGLPCLVLIKWLILVLCFQKPLSPSSIPGSEESFLSVCPLLNGSSLTEWIYSLPVLLLLGSNVFFLLWVAGITFIQLHRSSFSTSSSGRALRGLLILFPFLGLTYTLTLQGPSGPPLLVAIFLAGRAFLLSGQGLFITLPYCFLNREVSGVLRRRWRRWRLNRDLDRRKSLALTLESHLESTALRNEEDGVEEG